MLIWYGTGANGKTTTARVLMKVLGDYCDRAAPNLLIKSKHERPPTGVADLAGKRLVFRAEIDQDERLAEGLVKSLTGGDRQKARFLYKDFFSFEPTATIVLIVNHKPVITGMDGGIWRRVRLVPWEVSIPPAERRDQESVVAELVEEGPAILNWMLDGLRDWRQNGAWIAPEVQAATDAYRAEMDILADFIAERCILKPTASVAVKDLYEAYVAWCATVREEPVKKKTFTERLKDRGIVCDRTKERRLYRGIGLRNDTGPTDTGPRPGLVTDGDTFSANSSSSHVRGGMYGTSVIICHLSPRPIPPQRQRGVPAGRVEENKTAE